MVHRWSFGGLEMRGELKKFAGASGMGYAGEVLRGWGCGCTGEVVVVWVYTWSFGG